MKLKYCIGILFLIVGVVARGQSLSISGNVNTSNAITFTPLTAGDIPIAVYSPTPPITVFLSTTQSLKYSWRFGGIPGDPNSYIWGDISAKSSVAIPSGLLWTITADSPTESRYGITTGEKTLGIIDQILIRDIWSTMSSNWDWFGNPKTITNILTHELTITNFADLHPTSTSGLDITITYTLQ
jgi:hypothetical protein